MSHPTSSAAVIRSQAQQSKLSCRPDLMLNVIPATSYPRMHVF